MSVVKKDCDHPECNDRRVIDLTPIHIACSKSTWNFVAVDTQLEQDLEVILIGKNGLCVKRCCDNLNSWQVEEGGNIHISKSIHTIIHLNCKKHYEQVILDENHQNHMECKSYCMHLLKSSLLTTCNCAHFYNEYPNHVFKVSFPDKLSCKTCQIILTYFLKKEAEQKMDSIEEDTRDGTDKLVFVYVMCNLYIYCLQQAHTAKYLVYKLNDVKTVMRFMCMAGETMAALCLYVNDPINKQYTKLMMHCFTESFIKFIELLLNHSAKYIEKLDKIYKSDWKLFNVIWWFIIEFVREGYIPNDKRIMKPLLIFSLLFREKSYVHYIMPIHQFIIQKLNQSNVDKCLWLIRWLFHSSDGIIPYSEVLYYDTLEHEMAKFYLGIDDISSEGYRTKMLNLYFTQNPVVVRAIGLFYSKKSVEADSCGVYQLIADFHQQKWKGKSVYKHLLSIDKYSMYLTPQKNDLQYDYVECQWRNCCHKKIDSKPTGNWGKCSKCKLARYCSKHCQKLDWKLGYHKNICFYVASR